jgi:hypothetical protein
MKNKKVSEQFVYYTLCILLAALSLNAFGGGYYGMSGARGVPVEWLKNSPFHNYFLPGLILLIFVGGSSLMAFIFVFRRHRMAHKAAFTCGIITLLWMAIQLLIIGYVSWLQPTIALMGIFILLLTLKLPPYGA